MAGNAGNRAARRRSRAAPVATVLIRGRWGWPGGVMTAGGIAHGRAIQAISAGRDPAPVRQSELPSCPRSAGGRAARLRAAPVAAAVPGAGVRCGPVRRAGRWGPVRRAGVRDAGLRGAVGHRRAGRRAVRYRRTDDLTRHWPVIGEWAGDVWYFAPGDRAQGCSRAWRRALAGRAAAGCRAAVRGRGMRAAGTASRRIPLVLPGVRRARRPGSLRSRRHLARPARRMAVVTGVGRARLVLGGEPLVGRVGSHGRLGAVVAPVALVPGWTVRVTAEAAVATFHHVPPAAPQHSCPCPLSVGRQKSPV
jgi:hypothetical protein